MATPNIPKGTPSWINSGAQQKKKKKPNKPKSKPQSPDPTPQPSPVPPGQDVTNDRVSAYHLFEQTLKSWGIPVGADIQAIIQNAVIEGITPDMIELIIPDIQATQTWKNRFPGWEQRVNAGYNQLTVGQYLELEDSYHRILQSAGLPKGFYDSPADFGSWIANDVSPDELQNRVNLAMESVRKVDPTARQLLTQFYGVTAGDLASYFLDQKRALPTLERQYQAVNVAQWAARNGLRVYDSQYYENLVDSGISSEQAAQGYSVVGTLTDSFGKLGKTYGLDYGQRDAEQDVFFGQDQKRRKLVALEQATFSGGGRGATGSAQRGTNY